MIRIKPRDLTVAAFLITASIVARPNPSAFFRKLEPGMKLEKVQKKMGPPEKRRTEGEYEVWSYTIYTDFGPTAKTIYFKDGVVSHTGTEEQRQEKMTEELAERRKVSDEISKIIEEERKKEAKEKNEMELRKEALLVKKRELELKNRELAIKEAYVNFNGFLVSLNRTGYVYDRYDLIATSLGRHYVTCSQVVQILSTFHFTSEKMKALRILRYRILDPQNRMLILSHFDYQNHRIWANHILNGY